MNKTELTEAELNKINYNDQCISNILTDQQKEVIEKKEIKRLKIMRTYQINKIKDKKTEEKIFLNHKMKWINKKDISEDEEEKEVAFYLK